MRASSSSLRAATACESVPPPLEPDGAESPREIKVSRASSSFSSISASGYPWSSIAARISISFSSVARFLLCSRISPLGLRCSGADCVIAWRCSSCRLRTDSMRTSDMFR